jgi:glycosyltransferase involved in cell wall biosynthesis
VKASVVIPTRNRRASLARLLESVRASSPPAGGFEVLVVNDGGQDVSALAAQFGARSIMQPHSGVAAARNRGVEAAQAEFVLFTDDDCRVAPDWIERLTARALSEPSALVAGRVLNGLPHNPWASCSQTLHDLAVEWFNSRPGQPGFFTGNNFCIRRQDWLSAGGMSAAWRVCGGEEREFALRWAARGGRVVLEHSAVVHHFHDLTAIRFLDQQFRYGRGARFARGPKIPHWTLYRRILTASPGLPGRLRLALSQAAVAAGWTYEAVAGAKQKVQCL